MRAEDRIGHLAVSHDGHIYEVTEIKHDFHNEASVGKKTRPIYIGVDIFSGLPRTSPSPTFLSYGVVTFLREVLEKV